MMRPLVLVLAVLTHATAFAEAGIAPTMCGKDAGCECGTNTCACGEVCQGTACCSGVVVFCTSDPQCEVPCGSFICEMNRCVPGPRPIGGAGGGYAAASCGGAGGNSTQPPNPPARGCGCAATPAASLLGAVLASLLLRRRAKLCPQRDSNSR